MRGVPKLLVDAGDTGLRFFFRFAGNRGGDKAGFFYNIFNTMLFGNRNIGFHIYPPVKMFLILDDSIYQIGNFKCE